MPRLSRWGRRTWWGAPPRGASSSRGAPAARGGGRAAGGGRPPGGRFVSTGPPGPHILYDDGPSPGFEPATTARSLRASVAGDDVVLTRDAVPGGASYEAL